MDETDMAQYRRQLRDWEAERERQMNEFTITEKDLITEKSSSSQQRLRGPTDTLIRESIGSLEIYKQQPEDKKFKSYKVRVQFLQKHCGWSDVVAVLMECKRVSQFCPPANESMQLIYLLLFKKLFSSSTT